MARIGIIGGGQLAAMLVQACTAANAKEGSDHQVLVLDASENCPAAQVGGVYYPGSPATGEGYDALAADSDILTIDLENVSVPDLIRLESEGHRIVPSPALLDRVTDKLLQKNWLTELELPTADYIEYRADQEITAEPFGFPVVQKAARGGYDGRGVAVLHSTTDNASRLKTDGYLERYIKRQMEVSVMVAANGKGDVKAYQPVEMVFHEGGNVLDYLVAPARISDELVLEAQQLALTAITSMQGKGIFGIEMFLTTEGKLLINEISPRTHNSGHYTTEACRTSQFTQQLNILTEAPLGNTDQLRPAVMFNLLGAAGFEGDTIVEQFAEADTDPEVAVHLYGKSHCFPGRKMGHVTCVADTLDAALEKMEFIRPRIQIRGANRIG